ncbi:MAG: hypothetical protein KAJ10_15825 [Thermodesulfovibrionia bacterium]|nr:hypothetical protein [Thermodesulfovibrionia bacterium]
MIEEGSKRQEAFEIVDAIEEQFNTGLPKKSVLKALISGLLAAGSTASIGPFLLSCIG